jgi:hypothetical protein
MSIHGISTMTAVGGRPGFALRRNHWRILRPLVAFVPGTSADSGCCFGVLSCSTDSAPQPADHSPAKPKERASNGHDRDHADGSRAEAARDTHAEDNAGKPFNDAYLRGQYRLAHVFDYTLPDGTLLYQQNRYELRAGLTPTKNRLSKRFLPHRKVNGGEVFGGGDRRVIYNWPAVMRAGPGATAFVAEGEKNANALIKSGLLATTVLSHKWTSECVTALTGYHIIILEDHDDSGRKQSAIARKELSAGAASIRVVPTAHLWKHLDPAHEDYREIKVKDDVENWIQCGGDLAKLLEICREIMDDKARPKYIVTNLATVKPRAVRWIWPGHLARGGLELIAGTPEIGKSQIHCQYIACATTGREWPDGALGIVPCRVILLTAEDTVEDTLVPRLKAAKADLTMIEELKTIRRNDRDEMFLLGEDLSLLEEMIRDFGDVGLVAIDPITAYMGHAKNFDSHRATDVRSQLSPLKKLAEQTGVAFSAITHPPKNASSRALDHFIGSQAFIAAARIGHLCVAEMEEGENGAKRPTGRRFFTNPKINIGARQPTLAYHIDVVSIGFDEDSGTVIEAPVVCWDGETEITAEEALATAKPAKAKGGSPKDFLSDILISGPLTQQVITERGAERGFNYKQLWRAKEALGVVDYKERGVKGGPSRWALPEHAPDDQP